LPHGSGLALGGILSVHGHRVFFPPWGLRPRDDPSDVGVVADGIGGPCLALGLTLRAALGLHLLAFLAGAFFLSLRV
jgi:hypothetical protein